MGRNSTAILADKDDYLYLYRFKDNEWQLIDDKHISYLANEWIDRLMVDRPEFSKEVLDAKKDI